MNLISLLFGILPESIFFTLFIIFAKQLKKRKIPLFLMIFALDVGLSWFCFTIYYHILFVFGIYGIMWFLYKSHIIDVFLITIAFLTVAVLGYTCYYGISNYFIAAIASRILLFVTLFIIRKKLNVFYTVYRKFWNRADGAKIKSITVRNISCVVLNLILFLGYLALAVHSSEGA